MIFVFLALGLLAGVLIGVLTARLGRASALAQAQAEAKDILAEANELAAHRADEAKLIADEVSDELWSRYEDEINALEERVKALDDDYRSKRSKADRAYNQDLREVQKQMQDVQEHEKLVTERQDRFDKKRDQLATLHKQLVSSLQTVSSEDPQALKTRLAGEYEAQTRIDATKKAKAYEDDIRQNAEEIAKKMISTALNRFPRPAPTERGVGVVEIPNEDVKKRMLGLDGRNLDILQELCGLELAISDANTFQLTGYDPVQREVTTRCLEKLLHERAPNEDTVRRLYEKTKNDVARKIESDGNRIAAELGQKDLNPEIKKMLGTLRYRYSFAQNQHFHVAEVGWLCGLLASELGSVERQSAKRAGLLHDVGKAMDHNQEGGHAVLGADFIKNHGEKEHIVHAVRAHHYEEQPTTDLCFLVIAADAISGARPGARRSTVTVYNQKIEALTTIAEGFRGVTKTLILNAGREVRVIVDGRRVNDEKALKMCREIADKIEEECQYPGQIKVVVIRETHAEATARA
jgi:ribonuclease Y